MFLLLLKILLWLILLGTVYFVVAKFLPKFVLASIGTAIILVIIALAFYNPNNILVLPTFDLLFFPFKPIGISLILLILGITKIKKDKIEKIGKILIISSLIILLLSSMPILAYQLAKTMEKEGLGIKSPPAKCYNRENPEVLSPEDFADCFQYDFMTQDFAGLIVLLGRHTTEPNLPYRTQIQVNNAGDRILYTAELYKQQVQLGTNPLIVVSAAPREDFTGDQLNRSETNDLAILLQNLGVPLEQIILDYKGYNIRNSALELKNIIEDRGLNNQRILLVTSALNMRRAKLTFTNLGLNIIPRPTDFYGIESNGISGKKFTIKDFFPSAQALVITTEVTDEFFATLYYFLRGWLSPPIN